MALAAALLPAIASGLALTLHFAQDPLTACNPLFEGCISISHAARTGLANALFRALILPAAVFQAATWLGMRSWLDELGTTGHSGRWIAWLGAIAGIFLVLYGTFLGIEGDVYRWLRRYGINVYFGLTYLCMLLSTARLHARARAAGGAPHGVAVALLALLAILLAMGLFNGFVRPVLGDEALRNRIENALEWYAGLGFTIFFLVITWLWRRSGFHARTGIKQM